MKTKCGRDLKLFFNDEERINHIKQFLWSATDEAPQNQLDLVFSCDNGAIAAHLALLKSLSPLIASAFDEQSHSMDHSHEIIVSDIGIEVVQKSLELIYTGITYLDSKADLDEVLDFCCHHLGIGMMVDWGILSNRTPSQVSDDNEAFFASQTYDPLAMETVDDVDLDAGTPVDEIAEIQDDSVHIVDSTHLSVDLTSDENEEPIVDHQTNIYGDDDDGIANSEVSLSVPNCSSNKRSADSSKRMGPKSKMSKKRQIKPVKRLSLDEFFVNGLDKPIIGSNEFEANDSSWNENQQDGNNQTNDQNDYQRDETIDGNLYGKEEQGEGSSNEQSKSHLTNSHKYLNESFDIMTDLIEKGIINQSWDQPNSSMDEVEKLISPIKRPTLRDHNNTFKVELKPKAIKHVKLNPRKKEPVKLNITKHKGRGKRLSGAHPAYKEMILAAIENLEETNGSTRESISSYILETFEVPQDPTFVKKRMRQNLRHMVKCNELVVKDAETRNALFMIA